ncbi:hypothetical protein, partial [Sinorhizobium medicae]|uniref:hypothetical protein n=1 Tax=Sinorhizobium medicae TaxID=110321 RepID=UPI0027DC602F
LISDSSLNRVPAVFFAGMGQSASSRETAKAGAAGLVPPSCGWLRDIDGESIKTAARKQHCNKKERIF